MKKSVVAIFTAVMLLVGVGGYKVWHYYQETYVGKDYYAIVQEPLPTEETINDDSGSPVGTGFIYHLQAVDTKGNKRSIEMEVITTGENKNGDELVAGTIFKIEASQRRIIKEAIIAEEDIPASIKEYVLTTKEEK